MALRKITNFKDLMQESDVELGKNPNQLAIIGYMEKQLWILREMCMDVKKVLQSEDDLIEDALEATEQAVEDIEVAKQDITKAIQFQSAYRKKQAAFALTFLLVVGIVLLVLGLKGFFKIKRFIQERDLFNITSISLPDLPFT